MKFLVAYFFAAVIFMATPLADFAPARDSKINGVNFVAPREALKTDALVHLKRINSQWVALNPFAFSRRGNPDVIYNARRQWWGDTKDGVVSCVKLARKSGMKIFLKPHVWVLEDGWAGDFEMQNESDWKKWENDYEKYILDFAKLADSMNVELFSIGVEYKKAVQLRNTFWKNLIGKIRKVYKGKLTYAANWDEYQQIDFWDRLDYIGIDAYFPLSEGTTPSVKNLKGAWENTVKDITSFQSRWGKPILFTEYGYRSLDKCAGNQWELPDHDNYSGKANLKAQVNAYESIYQSFWNQSWFAGGFIWKWYSNDAESGGPNNNDYTPQHKPVEQTIGAWYAKSNGQ